MNDNVEKTNEGSKNQQQRRNKNERETVGRDIKNRMDDAVTKSDIEGDPTRSDE
jgi:hypothetical protein